MVINCFEYSKLSNDALPKSWQSQKSLDELQDFLQHNWDERQVFYEDGTVTSKQQFISFLSHRGLKAKNYIGTIAFKGEQLNIFPKMFNCGDLNQDHPLIENLMHNIITWLEYCNKIEYPFIKISSNLNDAENLKELFITLYLNYVINAIDHGLFYQYVEETDDCNCIKGKFDIRDYTVKKISQGKLDKFKCSFSTFEFDNKVNRIIKYTCRVLINKTNSKNQKIINRILKKLNDVSDICCVPNDCDNVRLSKMHRHYQILLSMSKMFLLNCTSDYSIGLQESFCFLFPMELLFEGFIAGYIQELLYKYNAQVCIQESKMSLIENIIYEGKSLGNAFTMKHDILVKLKDKMFILDTKYKAIDRFEDSEEFEVKKIICEKIKQGDIYQVCEYARKRNVQDVYLLYPMYIFESEEPSFPIGISESNNGGNNINVHFVRLPFIFEKNSIEVKKHLESTLLRIFNLS